MSTQFGRFGCVTLINKAIITLLNCQKFVVVAANYEVFKMPKITFRNFDCWKMISIFTRNCQICQYIIESIDIFAKFDKTDKLRALAQLFIFHSLMLQMCEWKKYRLFCKITLFPDITALSRNKNWLAFKIEQQSWAHTFFNTENTCDTNKGSSQVFWRK